MLVYFRANFRILLFVAQRTESEREEVAQGALGEISEAYKPPITPVMTHNWQSGLL